MKHSHYHKDVSGLQSIDVYRVLKLFEVTDPCLQHAIKKLLVAGGRGAKAIAQDVREAIDTMERWQAMEKEDESPFDRAAADALRFGTGIVKMSFDGADVSTESIGFDEIRMDAIGQNGNDGLHYGQCLSCKRESCACP